MNIGIYLSTLADHNQLGEICDAINTNLDNQYLHDASIFYDTVAFNPFQVKCGIFNSTELWNFSGTLITTSLNSILTSIKIVNKIEPIYYYGFEKRISPLSLIFLANNNVKFVCRSEDSRNDLYRKTGKEPFCISTTFSELIKNLG